MNRRVCLIIADGLCYDTARAECGYLEAAVAAGQARIWQMKACLPTISAPLYETIQTGLEPLDHGILSNEALRASAVPNLFSIFKAAGRKTGIVGHSYFHTLYGGSAFDHFEHIEINDPAAPVPYARYYSMEASGIANAAQPADVDLCAQTWAIARDHAPDYLLMHSSSCDTLAHFFSADSREYRIQAWKIDNALSRLIPRLVEAGYDVMVTADHGLNGDGHHGGNQPALTDVPFYAFSDAVKAEEDAILDQRTIAPTVLALAGIKPDPGMKTAAIV